MGRNAHEERHNLTGSKVEWILRQRGKRRPWRLLGWGQGADMERQKKAEELTARSNMSLSINSNGAITAIEECGPKARIWVTLICRCLLCSSYSLSFWWKDVYAWDWEYICVSAKDQEEFMQFWIYWCVLVKSNSAIIKIPRNSKASVQHRGPCVHEKCIWSSKRPLCANKDSINSSCFKKHFIAFCLGANGYFGKDTWR